MSQNSTKSKIFKTDLGSPTQTNNSHSVAQLFHTTAQFIRQCCIYPKDILQNVQYKPFHTWSAAKVHPTNKL